MALPDVDQQAVAAFIGKWRNTPGGAERANYVLFLSGLCRALGLDEPDHAQGGVLGSYQFEGPVAGGSAKGNKGFIDLYRKGSFVLEAKQSQIPVAQRDQPELFDPAATEPGAPSGAKYDRLMRDALRQARTYAVNLPADHPWPPFLIVCDVGRAFELYFDWSGNGRGYDLYPDRQSYRITIDRLADPDVQKLFRAIWLDPASRDPRLKAAEVTRAVAKRLADVSKWLEEAQRLKTVGRSDYERSFAIEETSLFLMRILFCMFAEDVGLLPKNSFKNFLAEAVEVDDDQHFQTGLRDLWTLMGSADAQPRWSWVVKAEVRYFNGGLFENAKTFVLGREDRGELLEAAKAEWRYVEPAIFGTLLEQALTPEQRSQLGAHYTPRPYVERLVRATIMEVLEGEWEAVQRQVEAAQGDGQGAAALDAVRGFHARLCALRILDPACGTGNFLYVAMELLLRLEADVLVLIEQLGGKAEPGVGPHHFYGLELNSRAAVIAELVLWIGWLRWRTSNDPDNVPEPVLRKTDAINFGGHAGYDAVLRHKPTGEADTERPLLAEWPQADFIVGNPPFIGKGAAMRRELGNDYCAALGTANPRVAGSADFVMQWWDRAATILVGEGSPLIRFGFVTTNSITGSFNRRVVSRHLAGEGAAHLSLIYAVPDHPWYKAEQAAAVRIAMTVAERGDHNGTLCRIASESSLDSDRPVVSFDAEVGKINADLTIGADATSLVALKSNDGLSSNGMLLAGRGFVLTRQEAEHLRNNERQSGVGFVRPYLGGSDLLRHGQERFVIDFGLAEEREAREAAPLLYQHLLATVRVARTEVASKSSSVDAQEYARRWWQFAKPRRAFREAIAGLSRYIATTETAKHRVFQFVGSEVVPDHMVIGIASDDPFHLGILTSRFHLEWTLRTGAWLGVGNDNRYSKSLVFDPYPFPMPSRSQRDRVAELADELDTTRKLALGEVTGLTVTELYNLRDKVRTGATLDLVEQDRARAARAGIVNRLHEQLDEAVAAAYGWPADLPPAEIVARLVALNAERAAEEAAGTVRWLRPDYQRPRFGAKPA